MEALRVERGLLSWRRRARLRLLEPVDNARGQLPADWVLIMLRVEGQVEQVQREWEVVQIRDVFGLARCPRDEVVPVEVVRKAPLGRCGLFVAQHVPQR